MIQRYTYFDSLKFILIFLVVVGHVIGSYKTDNHLILTLHNWIYAFHMPLFVFISGYFSKSRDFTKIKKTIITLFETYIIIQLVSIILPIGGGISLTSLITPWWISWYLLSLIFWRILVYIIPDNTNVKIIIIISILISLFVGFIKFVDYPLSLSRTFVFAPFFLAGYFAGIELINKIRSYKKIIGISILIIVFVFFCYSDTDFMTYFSGANSYMKSDNILNAFIGRIFFLVMATIMSLAFMNVVPDSKFFASTGKDTLIYYIYHIYLVIALKMVVDILNIEPSLSILLAYSVFVMIILYIISKFRVFKYCLNPITYLISKL